MALCSELVSVVTLFLEYAVLNIAHHFAELTTSLVPNSAIDNATRSLISLGQLPVTCGLFFSLGQRIRRVPPWLHNYLPNLPT